MLTIKLNMYLSKKIISSFVIIFLVFIICLTILSWIDILRFEYSNSTTTLNLLYLASLKAPIAAHSLIPIMILLTSLHFFITLSRSGELIIIRSAGRSILRSLIAPILTIFFIGIFLILIINPLNTVMYKVYDLEVSKLNKPLANFSLNDEGIWLREGSKDSQRVIHAKSISDNSSTLRNLTIFEFDENRVPTARIQATSATVGLKEWDLSNVKVWKVSRDNRPEDRSRTYHQYKIKTDLNIKKIKLGFGEPNKISIWELSRYIDRIENAGFSSREHRVYLNKEIALPVLMIGMFLIGGALNMGQARFTSSSLLIIVSVILGIGGFLLNNLTRILSENGAITPFVGAWVPPIILIFFALAIILHYEDG